VTTIGERANDLRGSERARVLFEALDTEQLGDDCVVLLGFAVVASATPS
jgi:hypothetical protein